LQGSFDKYINNPEPLLAAVDGNRDLRIWERISIWRKKNYGPSLFANSIGFDGKKPSGLFVRRRVLPEKWFGRYP
jgi:hypothetical protein